jgi:hypothetical protein
MTEKTTPPDELGAASCSVPLDPATCLALKPIHDIGNQAMKERDECNRWSVGIARMLNVSCSNFASDVVADQYAELRDRITQALNVKGVATCATGDTNGGNDA